LSGEKKIWSKSQYYYKIVDSNIAKEEVENLNKMIQSYNQKIDEVFKQKEEFLNFFE
jgi:ribosome recycling factor